MHGKQPPQVRTGIRALLHLQPGITIVGEATDGIQALRLAGELEPDVVLMDISMPRRDGLPAAARRAEDFPRIKVIMLSMHSDRRHRTEALRARVKGYLLMNLARALVPAVLKVAEGKTYYSTGVSHHLDRLKDQHEIPQADSHPHLTARQLQVLKLIAEGHTTRDIAAQLQISVKTAETHRTQLMHRLDIHDIASLVRYAIRTGLVKDDR